MNTYVNSAKAFFDGFYNNTATQAVDRFFDKFKFVEDGDDLGYTQQALNLIIDGVKNVAKGIIIFTTVIAFFSAIENTARLGKHVFNSMNANFANTQVAFAKELVNEIVSAARAAWDAVYPL